MPAPAGWSERRPLGDTNQYWQALASNSDGSILIAGIYSSSGRLYRSIDGGLNWTEIQPAGDTGVYWESADMSLDGQFIVVGGEISGVSFLATSSDGGTNWTERVPEVFSPNPNVFISCACNDDGSYVITNYGKSSGNEYKYYSSDYGVTWTKPALSENLIYGAAISSDGSHMYFAGDELYYSIDSGVNWTEINPIRSSNFRGIDCSSDGLKVIIGDTLGGVYVSSDAGSTWSESIPQDGLYFYDIAMDIFGDIIYGVVNNGRVYKSLDFGTSWEEVQPAGDANKYWRAVDTDSDGSNVIVASYTNGRIYTSSEGNINSHNPRFRQWGYNDDYSGNQAYAEFELDPSTKWYILRRSDSNVFGFDVQIPLNTDTFTTGTASLTGQLTSTLSTGTKPFVISSTTMCTNLNADLWDGHQFADYLNQNVETTSTPTFAGLTCPTLIGGTSTTADLNLKVTSGAGTTGSDMHFLVGSNGAVEAMTILNTGNTGIYTTKPDGIFEINMGTDRHVRLSYNDSNGSATDYSKFEVDSNGGLTITTVDSDGSAGNILLAADGKVNIGSDIYPNTNDTYYIGKNDDDTPFAWKGLILKDQTNGKYYRCELNNGAWTIVDLTD